MSFCELCRIVYRNETDKLSAYIKVSRLDISSEKTNMILFNNSSGPKELPQFKFNWSGLTM